MPSKRDVADAKARQAERDKKPQRLLKADPPTGVFKRLREARSSDVTLEGLHDLVVELATYSEANSAMRRSRRYHYLALEKAYEVWMEISAWEPYLRTAFYEQLDSSKKTSRGNGLHILLRFLIDYSDDPKANNKAVTRDVGALRHAARLGWPASEIASGFKRKGCGLLEMYKADIEARQAERGATEPKSARVSASPPPAAVADTPQTADVSSGDDGKVTIKTIWRGLKKANLASLVPGEHDVLLFGRINPSTNQIIIFDGHLTQRTKLDATARKDAAKLLYDAALILEKSLRKPPKRGGKDGLDA